MAHQAKKIGKRELRQWAKSYAETESILCIMRQYGVGRIKVNEYRHVWLPIAQKIWYKAAQKNAQKKIKRMIFQCND